MKAWDYVEWPLLIRVEVPLAAGLFLPPKAGGGLEFCPEGGGVTAEARAGAQGLVVMDVEVAV